ncbi:MAG: hypothetical protein ABSF82_12465 [Candidatus Bathyarchaeia archaeon]
MYELWLKTLRPSTRKSYGAILRRLFKLTNLTPQQALSRVKAEGRKNSATTYVLLQNQARANLTERTAYIGIFALRRFLFDNGVMLLPPTRLSTPRRVKPSTNMTWEQANRICDAASKPYNLILKLMLHCGWGIGEFLKFNSEDTWNTIRSYVARNPQAEYFRFNYSGRKTSQQEFYALVPMFMIQEIMSTIPVPIRATHGFSGNKKGKLTKAEGIIIDTSHYASSTKYIEQAFKTALKRAPIVVQGTPSVHELRDTFRTRATFVECAAEAVEFAMGHTIDPLGYNKAYYDEKWAWTNLNKIYGPSSVNEQQLKSVQLEAERVKQENELLKTTIIEALSAQREQTEKRYNELLKVKVKQLGVSVEGDLPNRLMTPAMKELQTEYDRLTKQLTNLGAIKKVDRVATT